MPPLINLITAVQNYVFGNPEARNSATNTAYFLPATIARLERALLYDEQINVRFRVGIFSGIRPKKNDLIRIDLAYNGFNHIG